MIGGIVGSLVGPITGLLDKVVEDKDKKAQLAHEIATMAERQAHAIAIAQIEVNKIEAQSPSFFKSSWCPFIGWDCGVAFAYHFVLQPIINFVVTASGTAVPELPEFDMSTLLSVHGGLLGLGTLRTYEKTQGISK